MSQAYKRTFTWNNHDCTWSHVHVAATLTRFHRTTMARFFSHAEAQFCSPAGGGPHASGLPVSCRLSSRGVTLRALLESRARERNRLGAVSFHGDEDCPQRVCDGLLDDGRVVHERLGGPDAPGREAWIP
jgi:hypothetical protein